MPGIVDPYAYPPRALDLAAAARYVGLTPAAFSSLVRAGNFPPARRLGDIVVWDRVALDAAFEGFPVDGTLASTPDDEPASRHARKRTASPLMSKEWPGYHNVYTPETLAERWSCSSKHIRNMIKRGDLTGFKHGGKLLRISAAVVAAYENTDTGKARGA